MYRLLVVDDEPIIVEGLFEKFQQLPDAPFEAYKALGGEEALDVARKVRIDLLLTDLKMPGMDGLELQAEIVRIWPKCKTIFLTGHNDFSSIQSSMRGGAFDYVLKMEKDETIIRTVLRAAEAIARQNSYDRMLSDARGSWRQALPLLRKEYVLAMLGGEASSPKIRAGRFAELQLPFRADDPVCLIVGKVDEWREDVHSGDKSLFLYGVHNVAEDHFRDECHLAFATYGQDRFLWLLQPKLAETGGRDAGDEAGSRRMLGLIESVQTSCRTYLKLPCSFVVGCRPCEWEQLAKKFEQLNFRLTQGLGLEREMLLSDGFVSEASASAPPGSAAADGRLPESEIGLLMHALERKDAIDFHRRLNLLSSFVLERDGIRSGTALALFYAISSAFLLLLNRRGMLEELSERIGMNKLLGAQEHASWAEAAKYFGELADLVIERVEAESGREIRDVVARIQRHVRDHLGGDLSLVKLAEIVHLTPFYLSRLYKRQTGRNLTEYIADLKLAKAKELLVGSGKKIYEIGLELGFHSSPYFNHYFKKMSGMTPQEYRDTWSGG